jgi:choline dehydrogenase-like flavoprotein
MAEEFDYIIAGAGSAGCVLANRLSADPKNRVLLLEAGGRDNWIWFHIPVGYLYTMNTPRGDWMFRTTPQPGLNGRSLAYPRGRVIGGSSAINAMIYMRGQAADYNGWRQLGLTGWSWDDVLPYFKKHEDHIAPQNDKHSSGGEWRVEHPRVRWEILEIISDALESAGIPKIPDFNTGDNFGNSHFQVNQKFGRRWSAARGFLKPALKRPNLKLETGVHIERVVIENGRAVGVEYSRDGVKQIARAHGEVIVSTGAVGTPVLLEQSGIGQGERLRSLGIDVVHDAPGVGENLQDHLQLRAIIGVSGIKTMNIEYQSMMKRAWMGMQYVFARKGPMTMSPSQFGAFAKSSPEFATANVQFHFQPLSLDKFGDPLHTFPAFTASICNLRPTSRGTIHAERGENGRLVPRIDPNYLSAEEDKRVAVDSLKLVRKVIAQPPLQRLHPKEILPGVGLQTDAELVKAAGDVGTTIFHPVGTAKMGTDNDRMAVVDERLRVRGIAGLRIVDASVMPLIVSGNTNSPTIMVAEKGAAMILEDAKR